jgi:predicted nucleic acid-binding protein
MTIVDTTVWIDYLGGTANPHTEWLDRQLNQQRLGLTDLILCEVLQGIQGDSDFARVRRELSRFEVFAPGGEDLAVASAKNYRSLRSRGCTVRKTIDCLIATFCLIEGYSLLHRDRDFEPFEKYLGLQITLPLGLSQ